jgi:3-oxoacyl-[acyl-carrier-protein] synthase-1
MIFRIADNITTPLGETTAENYQAVKAGRSELRRYEGKWGIPQPFTASLFTDEQTQKHAVEGLTRFESLAYSSARKALDQADIDVKDSQTVFILSTTKADVELLTGDAEADAKLSPADAAKKIAERLGITTEPIVVCNACISGVAAIVLALRLLDAGIYSQAVVCGADVQCQFTISGFQSLMAVSETECRPFDLERLGLNLGEAAGTLVLSAKPKGADDWCIQRGAIRNDAFHISSPSKNGEGAKRALDAVLCGDAADDLALINAHGTATMFNDQMESIAIQRAGLSAVPVNGLKGYFGHTLGAAGLLETILSMAAIDDHTIIGTRGFEDYGVSGKIQLSSQHTSTDKTRFIKMISGFGGCNGTVIADRQCISTQVSQAPSLRISHKVRLTANLLEIDGEQKPLTETGSQLLTALYKTHVGNYPKFYKMDGLSKLGFIASELLLMQEGKERFTACEDRAVILFNHSSSIDADRKYLESIADAENYFPSPSIFVYTLPNIVTGEIAMRNSWYGETSFYIVPQRNDALAWKTIEASLADPSTQSVVGGWLDYQDDQHFEAELYIAKNS